AAGEYHSLAVAGPARPLSLKSIWPSHGGNTGAVSTDIVGQGFPAEAVTVRLRADGQPDIIASPAVQGRLAISATFDLRGAAVGPRDVVVQFAGGAETVLERGFTVEPGN